MDPRHDPRGFPFPGSFQQMHHDGHGWHMLIPLVFLALFALAFLWLFFQTRHMRPAAAAAASGGDAALTELRLRYARGEVTREEFLATEADLQGSHAPPSPSS